MKVRIDLILIVRPSRDLAATRMLMRANRLGTGSVSVFHPHDARFDLPPQIDVKNLPDLLFAPRNTRWATRISIFPRAKA